jgi:hypothetical protein
VVYAADTMSTNEQHDTRHDTDSDRRVPVIEAAQLLGITPDAVRARLRRGTLQKESGPDGETLVVLDADTTRHDGRPVGDTMRHDTDLVEALRAHIAVLERELADRKEEGRRKDHLLAAALERIPALEEPSEPRESPGTVSEEAGKGTATPNQQEPSQRRSWWQRLFGLE